MTATLSARPMTRFRGAKFASKQARRSALRENTSNTQFDKPPALASFHSGQILYARVYFDDEPGIYKVRPVVFLRQVDRRVAEVLPVYSSIRKATRSRSVQVEIGQRHCYLSVEPIHVDRVDLVTSTRANLDVSQLQAPNATTGQTVISGNTA